MPPPPEPLRPWLTRDDRGVVRRLYCGPLSPILSALSRERVRIATYSLFALFWLFAASAAISSRVETLSAGTASVVPWAGWLFLSVGAGHIAWFYYRALRDARPEAIARPLAAACCPCCRYSLAEIAAAPDGTRPCPECGAAWKSPALDAPPA